MDFVGILSTGVSGFAFLMLFASYQLTSAVQKKILDVNLSNTSAAKLREWEVLADKQLSNTRYFMAFSALVLIAGLFVLQLQHRPEADIGFSILPSETQFMPRVYAQQTMVELDQDGKGAAKIKSDYIIEVNNHKIHKELADRDKELEVSKASLKSLAEEMAELTKDSGFGTLFTEK